MKFSFNFLSERRGSKNYMMRKATDCYTSFCRFTSTLYNFLLKFHHNCARLFPCSPERDVLFQLI